MHRYLVVANQTLGSERLTDTVRERLADGPCAFHLVVPATHVGHHLVWTEGGDRAVAAQRLAEGLERFRALGAEVDGEVGDARPVDAIADALRRAAYDEIILVTFPPGVSRWLRQDLPSRVQRAFSPPMTHLVAAAPALHATR